MTDKITDRVDAIAPSESITNQPKEHPTRLITNIYLLVGMLILILSSFIEGDTLSTYLIGALVEFILAGLAWAAMRVEKLPLQRTARLRWPAVQDILLAIAVAPGLWIIGVMLNIIAMLILGYVSPAPPSQFPTTIPEALALMLATLVAAPICEEFIFRGYVQRAYERRRIWVGLVVGSMIFALYHLRFQGALAIVPVSLALSAIAWRTNSILPGIALHAAYNAIATILMVTTSFLSASASGALTLSLVSMGLFMTPISTLAFTLIWRRNSPRRHLPVVQPRAWLRWAWIVPLIGLAGVYGYSAVTEVIIGRFPQLLAQDLTELDPASAIWEDADQRHYTIQSWQGNDIGTATCRREAKDSTYVLTCTAAHDGYDMTQEWPFLADLGIAQLAEPSSSTTLPWWPSTLPALKDLLVLPPQSWQLNASWNRSDLMIRTLNSTEDQADITVTYDQADQPAGITLTTPETTTTVALPSEYTLIPYEWPWRLEALPFEVAYAGETTIVEIDGADTTGAYAALVNVQGGEPIWTPAGTFIAWKVIVSWEDAAGREQQQTAWYDADEPHTLLKLEDGAISYLLAPEDTTGH